MTFNMCVNLYVKDVKAEADFFLAIGFAEIKREIIAGHETVIIAPDAAGNARLQIWNIDFIRQMSPEVAENKPSLLFSVDNIADMHAKVTAQGGFTSELQNMSDRKVFNFQSPEGTYFAFAEER